MSRAAMNWIANGRDVGLSSKAIWAHMMGAEPSREWGEVDYPHDPDDFSRCFNLLRVVPEWRARIGEMARYGNTWAAYEPYAPDFDDVGIGAGLAAFQEGEGK